MRRVEIRRKANPRKRTHSVERRVVTDEQLRELVGDAYTKHIETAVFDLESGEEVGAVTRSTAGGRRKAVWGWWSE